MEEKTLNLEVSKIIETSFLKICDLIKAGEFKSSKVLDSSRGLKPSKGIKPSIELRTLTPSVHFPKLASARSEDDIRKKLYYARMWPELQKGQESRHQKMEERAKSTENFRNFYQEYLKEKPLFIKKEEVFRLREKIQSESEKNMTFKALREFYKPHDLSEFERHRKEYNKRRKAYFERRKKKIEEISKNFELNRREKHWMGEAHKRLKIELLKSKILQGKSRKSPESRDKSKEVRPRENYRELGLKYLDFTKKVAKEKPRKTKQKSLDFLEKLGNKPPIIYKNYLNQLRNANKFTSREKRNIYDSWKSDFKDQSLKSNEKYSKILSKAEFLDNQAGLFSKRLKYYRNDFDSRHKLNEMLINSISAKISILKDLG